MQSTTTPTQGHALEHNQLHGEGDERPMAQHPLATLPKMMRAYVRVRVRVCMCECVRACAYVRVRMHAYVCMQQAAPETAPHIKEQMNTV